VTVDIAALPVSQPPESLPQHPDADLKARLMAEFENWVDQMLLDEPAPRGVPEGLIAEAMATANEEQPDSETDRYSLFSALTSLTGEIRLQGRTFKQLSDLLSPLAEMPTMLAQLREAQSESTMSLQSMLESLAKEAEEEPVEFKQVCEVMIDLYDRLQRGLHTCDEGIRSLQAPRRKASWIGRVLNEPNYPVEQATLSVLGMRQANALTLARLGAALQGWGVQRIGEVGEPFDPERMTAIEVSASRDAEPGTVLVVHRSGYAANGVLKSTAQVTVSKKEVGEQDHDRTV